MVKRLFIIALILDLVFLWPSMVLGAACGTGPFYVDYVDGVDTQAGTSTGTAWKHAPGDAGAGNNANCTLAADNIVYFKGGVEYLGTITVNASGTAGHPIVFNGNSAGTWGTGRAIIDGKDTRMKGFVVSGRDYVTINNFEIRNMPEDATDNQYGGNGIYGSTVTGLTVTNCYIHNIGYWNNDEGGTWNWVSGIAVRILYPTNVVVSNSEITKSGYAGIQLDGAVNCTLSGNTIHEYINWGIDVTSYYAESTGNIIENNIIYDIHQYDCGSGGPPDFWKLNGNGCNADGSVKDANYHPHSNFIFLRGDSSGSAKRAHNNIIRNNLFYNNHTFTDADGTAMIYMSYANTNKVYNNVLVNPHSYRPISIAGHHNEIYNNTIYGPRAGTWGIEFMYALSGEAGNNTVKNNIIACGAECIYVSDATNGANLVSDNNLFYATDAASLVQYGSSYYSLAQWRTFSSQDANSTVQATTAALKFVSLTGFPTNYSTMDLQLQSDSPAVNVGADLNTIFTTDKLGVTRTGTWDMGAYEYQAPAGGGASPAFSGTMSGGVMK